MIDVRNNFNGGLNLDDSLLVMPKENYLDALNVTRDATAGSHDNVITNMVGNQLREYDLPALGDNVNIGAYAFPLRNTVIRFNYNTEGYHTVLQYSNTTKQTTKIFENLTDSDDVDILGFTLAGKITSVNVFPRSEDEGDLLFFLDSEGRPTTMNITRFIAGEYTPVTRDIIDVGKLPPLSPPSCGYGNDAAVSVNNTRNKFFRFKYRWLYDDFEKSTCSPISVVPIPDNILNDEYTNVSTNNNQISLSLNSGPQNVAKVELLVSFVDKTNIWSDFAAVEAIDKAELAIGDDTNFTYLFYNDATYPIIDPNESILLFDYVPDNANAQEMPNGNVLTYAAITEGLDRDLDPNVVITIETTEAGDGGTIGSLSAVTAHISDDTNEWRWKTTFTGVPAPGTVANVYARRTSDQVLVLLGTYTTLSGDTANDVTSGMYNSMKFIIGITDDETIHFGNEVHYDFVKNTYDDFSSAEIVPPATDVDDVSVATWPWSTQRSLGLAYFTKKGKTPGVMYSTGITFPEYAESGGAVLIPYINTQIFHVPPVWAHSYQWVITKEPTQWLFFMCTEVNKLESEYIYFNITNLSLNATKNPTTAAVISWTFQDGDRMRLIKRDSDDVVFPTSAYDIGVEGIVVDPEINGVATTGTFVKIKNIAPYTAQDYSSNFFVIQLYRPGQQAATDENEVYYEFGIEYPILNPETGTRVHAGEVTDQSTDYAIAAETNIYNGDSYFRIRTVYLSESGLGTFFIQDRNIVDTYISAVSSVDGRPLVIDVNQKTAYFSATGRFGQAYQANTNVNGLNRFYPNNFYDVDISYGDIMRLAVNDRRIWVFQKFKIGQLPIYTQINKQPDGTIVNVVTDQLINPVEYYAGNWGIGTASTSLVVQNYVAYFCDNINGVVLRLSRDGLTPISVLYKVNSWANTNLPLRNNTSSFIYGGYDQRLNNYIIAMEDALAANVMVLGMNGRFLPAVPLYYMSLSDIPVAGDNVSLTLTDGDGVIRTYEYEVQAGNSVTDVINSIYAQINGDIYFIASTSAVLDLLFPEVAMTVSQVTANNPSSFSGVATITYSPDSYSPAQTITFNEDRNSFESFLSLQPECMCTLGTLLMSFKEGSLWTHDNPRYNSFFGVDYESYITFVFNDVSIQKKTWSSIMEIASDTWDCPTIYTNVNSYGDTKQVSSLVAAEFTPLEGNPTATIKRDANSSGGKWNGQFMKGNYCVIKFRKSDADELEYLSVVSVNYINSPLTKT